MSGLPDTCFHLDMVTRICIKSISCDFYASHVSRGSENLAGELRAVCLSWRVIISLFGRKHFYVHIPCTSKLSAFKIPLGSHSQGVHALILAHAGFLEIYIFGSRFSHWMDQPRPQFLLSLSNNHENIGNRDLRSWRRCWQPITFSESSTH